MRLLIALLYITLIGCMVMPGKNGDDAPQTDQESLVPTEPLFAFNVLSFSNANLNSASMQGRLAVAQNATLENYAVGTTLGDDSSRCDLVIGGNLTFNKGSLSQGKACVHGKIYATDFGAKYPGSSSFTDDFDVLAARAQAIASELAKLKPIQSIDDTLMNGKPMHLNLTGTDPSLNVFAISADAMALTLGFQIDVPAHSTTVINIAGADVTIRDFGISLAHGNGGLVSFNFPDAFDVTITSTSLLGTLLAPQAKASFTNGVILGSLIAKAIDGDARYNWKPFSGSLSPANSSN